MGHRVKCGGLLVLAHHEVGARLLVDLAGRRVGVLGDGRAESARLDAEGLDVEWRHEDPALKIQTDGYAVRSQRSKFR